MPDLDDIRAEIERMRVKVQRQRNEILELQRAGISSGSAEALLGRMFDRLCEHRDQLKKAEPMKVLGGRKW